VMTDLNNFFHRYSNSSSLYCKKSNLCLSIKTLTLTWKFTLFPFIILEPDLG
jgi:hypothetical protein